MLAVHSGSNLKDFFVLGSAEPYSSFDSRTRGPEFDTSFDYILSFLLPLIQAGSCQLRAKVCALNTG